MQLIITVIPHNDGKQLICIYDNYLAQLQPHITTHLIIISLKICFLIYTARFTIIDCLSYNMHNSLRLVEYGIREKEYNDRVHSVITIQLRQYGTNAQNI